MLWQGTLQLLDLGTQREYLSVGALDVSQIEDMQANAASTATTTTTTTTTATTAATAAGAGDDSRHEAKAIPGVNLQTKSGAATGPSPKHIAQILSLVIGAAEVLTRSKLNCSIVAKDECLTLSISHTKLMEIFDAHDCTTQYLSALVESESYLTSVSTSAAVGKTLRNLNNSKIRRVMDDKPVEVSKGCVISPGSAAAVLHGIVALSGLLYVAVTVPLAIAMTSDR